MTNQHSLLIPELVTKQNMFYTGNRNRYQKNSAPYYMTHAPGTGTIFWNHSPGHLSWIVALCVSLSTAVSGKQLIKDEKWKMKDGTPDK